MNPVRIELDRARAKDAYRAYLTHAHYSSPVDDEIRRCYRLIAQGRMIIRALESVRLGGQDGNGLPRLAIARADQESQRVLVRGDGSATMRRADRLWRGQRASDLDFDWPAGSFPRAAARAWRDAEALVPQVPLPLRPKRALVNYHVLWEAEWRKAVPVDPLLMRRLGKGDLWLVVAQWDLTEVEREALQARIAV